MMNLHSQFRPLTLFVLILSAACSSVQTGRQPSLVSASGPNVVSSQHLFHPWLTIVFGLQGQAAIQNLERLNYQE